MSRAETKVQQRFYLSEPTPAEHRARERARARLRRAEKQDLWAELTMRSRVLLRLLGENGWQDTVQFRTPELRLRRATVVLYKGPDPTRYEDDYITILITSRGKIYFLRNERYAPGPEEFFELLSTKNASHDILKLVIRCVHEHSSNLRNLLL